MAFDNGSKDKAEKQGIVEDVIDACIKDGILEKLLKDRRK